MRGFLTRTVTTTTITYVTLVDGNVCEKQLEKVGNITEKQAQKILGNVIIKGIETNESTYQLSMDEFVKVASKID